MSRADDRAILQTASRFGAPAARTVNRQPSTVNRQPSTDDLTRPKLGEHAPRGLLGGEIVSRDDELGLLGNLVGRVDAGEVLDLARLRARIESLRIAPDALLDRSVDEDFDE